MTKGVTNLLSNYSIIYEVDEEGFYTIMCTDFEGCYSQGKTLEEAQENIKEAIQLCIEEKGTNSNYKTVSFDEIANGRIIKAVEEASQFEISDEELFEEHVNPYSPEQLAKINELLKGKRPVIVKNGVIQEDLENPDYLYLLEDD